MTLDKRIIAAVAVTAAVIAGIGLVMGGVFTKEVQELEPYLNGADIEVVIINPNADPQDAAAHTQDEILKECRRADKWYVEGTTFITPTAWIHLTLTYDLHGKTYDHIDVFSYYGFYPMKKDGLNVSFYDNLTVEVKPNAEGKGTADVWILIPTNNLDRGAVWHDGGQYYKDGVFSLFAKAVA